MTATIEQRLARLTVRLQEIRLWRDVSSQDLNDWRCDGQPLAVGESWPTSEGVVRFEHPTVTLPDAWSLENARIELDLGGEGLVWVGDPEKADEPFGLDPYHHSFPLRARAFSLSAEVVARMPFGVPVRDPRLIRSRLVLVEPSIERFARQLAMVVQAVSALGTEDVVDPLLDAADKAIDLLIWPSASDDYVARVIPTPLMQEIWDLPAGLPLTPPGLTANERHSVEAAVASLEADLTALEAQFPRRGRVALTGHAHLDLAWLWPLEETRRKAMRTFATALSLLDRYPEFRFGQTSAQVYQWIERDDPEMFARVKEYVATGRWAPLGGMWVEPDINMLSGESLTRQLLYGQRYFERAFGFIHTVCWLPDCFGFSPALPQLLRLAGIDDFFTIKLSWSETNRFPYDLFWWEGLDGSRVLAHMFDNPHHEETDTSGYNGDTGAWAVTQTWRNFLGKAISPETLLSVGYGDGGGGTTAEMIEQVRTLSRFPAVPQLEFSTPDEFFARLRKSVSGRELPVWAGELYLELHRGTLTTQGRIKYLNRRAERDLVAAETVASMSHLVGGPEPASLEPEWQIVLRNQFHDILPGSGIREVYETAEAELSGVVDASKLATDRSMRELAARVVPAGGSPALLAVNPDLSARSIRLNLDQPFPGAQRVESGWLLAREETIPGMGWASICQGDTGVSPLSVSENHLENKYLRVEIGPDGTLSSVYDRIAGREVLSGAGNQIWAFVDKPSRWDAWDIEADYSRRGELLALTGVEVVEDGAYRVALRLHRRFRDSAITQDIRLWSNSARLEFATSVDWHDRRWLLQARFPLAIRSNRATFETAFGVIERPTHRNTSWEQARFEVAAHRFVDLSEAGYGVALLNDSKYGHHALGNELGISLLRSPVYPDPRADEGRQQCTYALLPHAGDWFSGGVLTEAEDLNRPLLVTPVERGASASGRILAIDGLTLALGALKPREDGNGLIFRVYEPQGSRGDVDLRLPDGWRAVAEVDVLERARGEPETHFTPFQVRSWHLEKAPPAAGS